MCFVVVRFVVWLLVLLLEIMVVLFMVVFICVSLGYGFLDGFLGLYMNMIGVESESVCFNILFNCSIVVLLVFSFCRL